MSTATAALAARSSLQALTSQDYKIREKINRMQNDEDVVAGSRSM